jgi:hypothetical protein
MGIGWGTEDRKRSPRCLGDAAAILFTNELAGVVKENLRENLRNLTIFPGSAGILPRRGGGREPGRMDDGRDDRHLAGQRDRHWPETAGLRIAYRQVAS